MKCPYAVHRKVITQSCTIFDENNERQTGWLETQTNNAKFADCLKEECGAYNAEKKKCEYHS